MSTPSVQLTEETYHIAIEFHAAFISAHPESAMTYMAPEDAAHFRDPMTTEMSYDGRAKLCALQAIRHAVAFQSVFDKLKNEPDVFKKGVLKP